MKKIVTLLATVSAVAFLAACSEQEYSYRRSQADRPG